ncbi:MAG: protein-L-isoaspartate(D-aspartate) O-methyltransferase [Parvularculaceae bacterium]
MTEFERLRRKMIETQLRARGVRDERVLQAMADVPREAFVDAQLRDNAYIDAPLPIGEGQTISQPYIVAFMLEALRLKGGDKALEVGSGSGYAAAVMARLCGAVYAVERIKSLADSNITVLDALGVKNVHVRHGDGAKGWPEEAPFDAIMVSAGAPEIPESLKDQLAVGGRMVIPVGRYPRIQRLERLTRISQSDYSQESIASVQFVPLVESEESR